MVSGALPTGWVVQGKRSRDSEGPHGRRLGKIKIKEPRKGLRREILLQGACRKSGERKVDWEKAQENNISAKKGNSVTTGDYLSNQKKKEKGKKDGRGGGFGGNQTRRKLVFWRGGKHV